MFKSELGKCLKVNEWLGHLGFSVDLGRDFGERGHCAGYQLDRMHVCGGEWVSG